MDAQIGRVLDKLKETGLDKNTIIVFTSDHGYHLGEHGHWQKQTLFDVATRVPLIFAGPGIKKNLGSIDSPVELVDLYPTILELAEMQAPKFLSGKSLVPYFKNMGHEVRKSALTELQVNTRNVKAQGYSIKTKRYRLSQWNRQGVLKYELYDHMYDKSELTNLTDHIDYKSVKDSLITVLNKRITEANSVPLGLGRQFENVKPWFEPTRIFRKNE